MSMYSRATSLIVFLIVFGCAAAPHEGGSEVDFGVTVEVHDRGGQPVPGADVQLKTDAGLSAVRTDAAGAAKLEGVPAGAYCIRVHRDGFVDQFMRVQLTEADAVARCTMRRIGVRRSVDTASPALVTDIGGGALEIPAHAFDGPGAGLFTVEFTTMHPDDLGFFETHPGGFELSDGSTLSSLGVVVASAVDSVGAPARVRPGVTVGFSFPILGGDAGPAVVSLLRFDEDSGAWLPVGEAVRDDTRGVYRADSNDVGIFSIGVIVTP